MRAFVRAPNVLPILSIAILFGVTICTFGDPLLAQYFTDAPLRFGALVSATFGAVVFFDLALSKLNLMRYLGLFMGIPFVGGRWEGWKLSELSKDGVWQPFVMEISQGLVISCMEHGERRAGEQTRSQSLTTAEIVKERDHPARLIYSYETRPPNFAPAADEPRHNGTFVLELKAGFWPTQMGGAYFHNGKRFGDVSGAGTSGAQGEVRLCRAKGEWKRRIGDLNFNPTDWPEKPADRSRPKIVERL